MPRAVPKTAVSYADYLQVERASKTKHEFHGGEMFAMAGGTKAHAHLCTRLSAALVTALGRSPCRAFNSELRIYVPERDEAAYPDATVICGQVTEHPNDKDAATNPVAVFEVLSPTTERYDREDKFALYASIETVRDYVLISQDHTHVEHFARLANGTWTYRPLGDGDVLRLTGAQASVDVSELYLGVEDLRDEVG